MNKKTKFGFVIVICMLVVAIIFATCSGDTSDNQSEDKKTVASPFDHSKSKAKTKQNNLSSTKRPEATPDLTKQALLKLPVSGVVDYYYPENYLSPRYEAITFGNFESHDDLESNYLRDNIAITELNDPANSDLDPALFKTLREMTIDVARAEQTGQNASSYPRYFTKYVSPDTCIDFKINAAGAIAMPYPGDSNWYMGIVNWTAKCFPFGPDKEPKSSTLEQTIYIQKIGGVYTPVSLLDIPRKSLEEFAKQ